MAKQSDLESKRTITARTLERIYAEIDAGRPVLVGGGEDHCGSWSLVVGYDRAQQMLCHASVAAAQLWRDTARRTSGNTAHRWAKIRGYAPGSVDENFGHWNGRFRGTVRPGFVGGWQDNPAYLIGAKLTAPPDAKQNAITALGRAIELHHASSHHINFWGGVDYSFGDQAYTKWATALAELDCPADLEKPMPEGAYDWYCLGNMDMQVDQIVRGRTAAAVFCDHSADLLPHARKALRAAAKHYRDQVAIAAEAFATFTPRFDGNDQPRQAYLSDKAQCQAGAEAIRRMQDAERRAIGELKNAIPGA